MEINQQMFSSHKPTFLFIVLFKISLLFWYSCSDEQRPLAPSEEYEEITLLAEFPLDIRDPSGLALDPDGETLWVVSDNPGRGIYRITYQGEIVEQIEMDSDDLEGIIVDPNDNTLWVVEERLRQIVNISRSGEELQRVQLDIEGENENDGPEGITVNPNNGHFYVVNEANPRQLHELTPEMEIIKTTTINFSGIFEVEDLSGISYNIAENSLWIVSDTSEKIVVTDLNGSPIKAYNIDVFDPEGIALDASQRIVFIASDSDRTLYIFNY
ncbi:MAG: hypothetical protein EA391_07510 [Balneolaceae bacterium]|nr:MAG: hypothetical protein EA391_07510 [Balneolaceae bacterium]